MITLEQISKPFEQRLSSTDRELIMRWCIRNWERFRRATLEDLGCLVDLMVYRIWERDFTKDPQEFADARAFATMVLTYRVSQQAPIKIPAQDRQEVANLVADLTAQAFGHPLKLLRSKSRMSKLVQARMLGMYLMRRELQLSFSECGRAFDRDHTTAISAVAKIEDELTRYDQVADLYYQLREHVAAHGLINHPSTQPQDAREEEEHRDR